MACPVCFENLAKVFSFPKTSMLSKTKQQDTHANSTVTQHQIHVAVSVRALPRHRALYCTSCGCVCQGLICPIYTWVLRPTYIPGWWSLTRLGSHHGTSDKTGLAHRCSNKRNFKLSPSPTTAATARRLRPTVLVGRSAGCGGLFRRLEVLHDFHPFLRFARSGLRLGRLLQAAHSLLRTLLL